MRVLIDEDVDVALRHLFAEEIEAITVQYRGWKGFKNGELLRAAEAEFDALVTMDNNIPDQQNLSRFNIGIIILRPESDDIQDLSVLMPRVNSILPALQSGEVVRVFPPG